MITCSTRPPTRSFLRAPLLLAALLGVPAAGRAAELDVKVEPGVAIPLGAPQSDRFKVGGAGTVKGILGFESGWVGVTASLTFLGLPAKDGFASSSLGTAWAPGLGLRLQLPRKELKPHETETLWGARPWIDADILYVRTGGLDRAGFAAAVGVAVPLGESRSFWLGPFVRYLQVLQGERAGFDNGDAKTLIVGLSLETGTSVVHRQPPAPEIVQQPVAAAPAPAVTCPACPVTTFDKVIVKPDKLELKEKIQFLPNQAVIEQVSHPVLDEVAKVLQDNQGFRVQVEGHASSEGGDEHNQTLSEQRAQAVLDYLAGRGVSRDRLLARGFSSSRPIESNVTEAGREANRRVEFVVSFIILKEGNAQ